MIHHGSSWIRPSSTPARTRAGGQTRPEGRPPTTAPPSEAVPSRERRPHRPSVPVQRVVRADPFEHGIAPRSWCSALRRGEPTDTAARQQIMERVDPRLNVDPRLVGREHSRVVQRRQSAIRHSYDVDRVANPAVRPHARGDLVNIVDRRLTEPDTRGIQCCLWGPGSLRSERSRSAPRLRSATAAGRGRRRRRSSSSGRGHNPARCAPSRMPAGRSRRRRSRRTRSNRNERRSPTHRVPPQARRRFAPRARAGSQHHHQRSRSMP